MFGLVMGAAIVSLATAPSASTPAPPDHVTGEELATCSAAVDQPICLLRLAARLQGHRSFRANIAIGYSPDVLAAIGPDPADDKPDSFASLLAVPSRAAVDALIADRKGASPVEALAPIRAIPVMIARDPAKQPEMVKDAASQRIAAYRELWRAAHGEGAIPASHRPSDALLREALSAWRSDLEKTADASQAADLADAYRTLGDITTADAIAPKTPGDRMAELLDAGRYAEAADLLEKMSAEPVPAELADNQQAAKFGAALMKVMYASSRGEIEARAVAGGRPDVAIGLAEKALSDWLAGPASDPDLAAHVSTAEGLMVTPQLLLIVAKAPPPDALKWVERMDAAARKKTLTTAPISALAAMHAWTMLGEPTRARRLSQLWEPDVRAAVAACKPAAVSLKDCARRPAILIPMGLKVQPLDTPWDELLPMHERRPGVSKLLAGGSRGVEDRLAGLHDPWDRMGPLFDCMSGAAEAKDLTLATFCAHRLAQEAPAPPRQLLPGMPPISPERVDAILRVALRASEQRDEKVFHEMVALAMELAARNPDEYVGSGIELERLAIAELREQGRL